MTYFYRSNNNDKKSGKVQEKIETFNNIGRGKLIQHLNDRLFKYLKSCHGCILFIHNNYYYS